MVDFNYGALGQRKAHAFVADCIWPNLGPIYHAHGKVIRNECRDYVNTAKNYGIGDTSYKTFIASAGVYYIKFIKGYEDLPKGPGFLTYEKPCFLVINAINNLVCSNHLFEPRKSMWLLQASFALQINNNYMLYNEYKRYEKIYNKYVNPKEPQIEVIGYNSLLYPRRQIFLEE